MPFIAECFSCHTKVRVPDESQGMSIDCPTCGDSFTLAPMEKQPEVTAQRLRSRPKSAVDTADAAPRPRQEAKKSEPAAPAAPAMDEHWRRPWEFPYELIGGIGIICAGIGAAATPLPGYQNLAIGLGAAAVVIGIVGIIVTSKPNRGRKLVPAGACVVGAAVVALSFYWPHIRGLGPPLGDNVPRPFGRDIPAGGEAPTEPPDSGGPGLGSYRLGTIHIVVKSATVAPVKYVDGTTSEPALQIAIRLSNGSRDAPMTYRGWALPAEGQTTSLVVARDELDRLLRPRLAEAGKVVAGQVKETTVRPQGHVDDLLLFEAPNGDSATFRLSLPLAAVGGTGMAHLFISKAVAAPVVHP
jgi:hypothetical protein